MRSENDGGRPNDMGLHVVVIGHGMALTQSIQGSRALSADSDSYYSRLQVHPLDF